MDCSYYGTNEGELKGEPLTHMLIDDFFQALIDRNDAKYQEIFRETIKSLKESNSVEFKKIKQDIKIFSSDVRQLNIRIENMNRDLSDIKNDIYELKEELSELKKPKKKTDFKLGKKYA